MNTTSSQWGDAYGNWYRQDVEEIVNNGGAIGGIGIQYYPSDHHQFPGSPQPGARSIRSCRIFP